MNTATALPPSARFSGVDAPHRFGPVTSRPAGGGAWRNVLAIAGVVIKELYRRKDFYVLFILTALITLTLGSVNFFGEAKVARYL